MNANELMVGNYVNATDWTDFDNIPTDLAILYSKVLRIFDNVVHHNAISQIDSYNSTDLDYVTPIPITEDWLVKFGFEFCETETVKFYKKGIIELTHTHDRNMNWHWEVWLCKETFNEMNEVQIVYYDFVHQLQNMYFCLCGKQLKFVK